MWANNKYFFLSKFIALKRRILILFNKEFNPYPDIPKGMSFSPSEFQQKQAENIKPKLNLNTIN